MQIGAGLIRMIATHSLQIASTEHFFLLKNFVLLQIYFYFTIFEKYNSKIGEFCSRIIHSGTSHCPGMDLAGTRDISFHSGSVPGNPGHLVTLPLNLLNSYIKRLLSAGINITAIGNFLMKSHSSQTFSCTL